PTPTNDVAFTIGQDSLRVNLGATSQLVPEDQFGISGSSRPIDPGFGYKGFRVGVMGWLHDDAELQLGDKLLAFLRDSVPARHNTLYSADVHALVASGFAPTVGYAGRITGDSARGFYVGGALHYYVGVGYGRTDGLVGDPTSDPLVAGSNPGNTTLGADVLNAGRGSVVHVGGEQRLGLFAVRGGVARDQRKRIEFGFGGGVRFGGLGLDVGFWTHTNSLSNERGITMATSLSI